MNSPEPYLLEKYYAVAVNQSTSYSGPITLGMDDKLHVIEHSSLVGDSDYIHVVIWLNGNTTESSHGDEEGNSGIEVMSSDYTSCMINLGIGINARSHPDFASKMGSLKIGILPSCEEFVHEFLGQKYNRLVIFGPGISFRFTSGSTSPSEINHEDANLSDEIIVGVVYVFKRTLLS